MRVPLIICGDGIPAGQRTDAMCYLFDVFPTLGSLCGVPPPARSEGIDLTPTLKDPSRQARGSMMLAYKNVQRSVSDGQWKLVRYPQVDRTQLFDLRSDPSEVNDLAAKPEQSERIKGLLALLTKEQSSFGDEAPLHVPQSQPAEWTPPQKGARAKKQDPNN
jgi:arylsulfatase A-like enzyme